MFTFVFSPHGFAFAYLWHSCLLSFSISKVELCIASHKQQYLEHQHVLLEAGLEEHCHRGPGHEWHPQLPEQPAELQPDFALPQLPPSYNTQHRVLSQQSLVCDRPVGSMSRQQGKHQQMRCVSACTAAHACSIWSTKYTHPDDGTTKVRLQTGAVVNECAQLSCRHTQISAN